MTQTISVHQVLRETVQGPYSDLVTRPTGRAVRISIRLALSAQSAALAMLDFSEVGLVDFSCADEVIAQLLLDPPTEATIVLQGLSEEQLEAIEHVLDHHDLAVLVHDPVSGAARMVGRASPDLRVAFLTLRATGPATAASLAGRMDWTFAQAQATLHTLARLHFVRVEGERYTVPLAAEPASP